MRRWAHWCLSTATYYCFTMPHREPLMYPTFNKNYRFWGFPTVASDSNHNHLQRKAGVTPWTLELPCSFAHTAIGLKLFKSVCDETFTPVMLLPLKKNGWFYKRKNTIQIPLEKFTSHSSWLPHVTNVSFKMAKTYSVQHLEYFVLLAGIQSINDHHQPCLILSETVNGFCHPGH